MTPTEVLMEEHEAIKTVLSILDRISQKLSAGEEIDIGHLEQILDFIKTFADRCHHGKEEDILFPAMEQAGIPRQGGPIGIMLMEHDEGRGYVRGLDEGIKEYREKQPGAKAKIVHNATNYAELLRQHIDKENNILYPMGDAHLSAQRQQELLKEFDKIEEERIGAGKHEEFHRMIASLKDIYGV
ncbi:MAG: hemerythrin domain-containing protein [Chloroflexi bacterium]|nr:hemerythrin domain-containing protein [Chloroflexota bacterium]